jgi:hypothetical protein
MWVPIVGREVLQRERPIGAKRASTAQPGGTIPTDINECRSSSRALACNCLGPLRCPLESNRYNIIDGKNNKDAG